MRHRVTFQRPVEARNDRNEMVTTWQNWKTISAAVLPDSGREFYRAKQENAEITGILKIRYLKGLERTMRAKFCGRILELVWVRDPQERRKEMRVAYKEAQ